MLKTASVTKVRRDLKEYIADMAHTGTVLVMKHSEPVAVLLSISEYENYLEYLETLSDLAVGQVRVAEFLEKPEEFSDAEGFFDEEGI